MRGCRNFLPRKAAELYNCAAKFGEICHGKLWALLITRCCWSALESNNLMCDCLLCVSLCSLVSLYRAVRSGVFHSFALVTAHCIMEFEIKSESLTELSMQLLQDEDILVLVF